MHRHMSSIWTGKLIEWRSPRSWVSPLSRWLRPYLAQGIRTLERMGEQDLCDDDSQWLKIAGSVLRVHYDEVAERLGHALSFATLRTFHACRVADAGTFARNGIRRNDPEALTAQLRKLLDEEPDLSYLKPSIEDRQRDAELYGRDAGRVYVVLDDKSLIRDAGHYLLYGSEWIMCMVGSGGHEVLRRRGVPTMLQIDLPLSVATDDERRQLAQSLLQEWARIKVNRPDWVPEVDFTFCLHRDVPAKWLVGHYHPTTIPDVHYGCIERPTLVTSCPHCRKLESVA
jgi:hypothetical protein